MHARHAIYYTKEYFCLFFINRTRIIPNFNFLCYFCKLYSKALPHRAPTSKKTNKKYRI